MSTHRVLKYEGTVYYASTGSSHTKQYTFTQAQADQVGAVLETDGIPIEAAKRLCDKWTKAGQHGDIRYSYRIPFVRVTMKIKTSELIGPALDWAVAKCEFVGTPPVYIMGGAVWCIDDGLYNPSLDWAQGGPIIEREGICHGKTRNGKAIAAWMGCASDFGMVPFYQGATPLIAAMRCYVASKFGDEVEIPDELLKK